MLFRSKREKELLELLDKYRKNDGKTDFLHTLNGSGVATPRLLVALLESHQNKNGSINIPEPLQPYFGSNIID